MPLLHLSIVGLTILCLTAVLPVVRWAAVRGGPDVARGRRARVPRRAPACLALAVIVAAPAIRAAAQDTVPPLVQISGDLVDQKGRALSGPQTVTLALYREQSGDAPLWLEVQVVTADTKGHFLALLGASSPNGLPLDLFTTGQARYLGMQVMGQPEQPRLFLASVPYALAPLTALTNTAQPAAVAPATTPSNASAPLTGTASPNGTAVPVSSVPPTSPVFSIVTDATSGLASTVTNNGATVTLNLIKTCASGQLLKWNGTSWGCTADTDVTIDVTGGGLNVLANGTSPNIVGGFGGNSVAAGAVGAAIGGGGEGQPGGGLCPPFPASCNASNRVAQSFGTIGGGEGNQAGNSAGVSSVRSYATVGGGRSNVASGLYSTVPGGTQNEATGSASFAAGFASKANHSGTFVWSDQSGSSFASTAANQFLIHASGGVGIGTNAPTTMLDVRGHLNLQDGGNNGVFVFPSTGSGLFIRSGLDSNYMERMFISGSTGRVGIGTTTPSQMLDVAGNANVVGGVSVSADVNAAGNVKGSQLCIGADCRNAWPSGGAGIGGSGAPNALAKFSSASSLTASSVSDDGSNVNIGVPGGALRVLSIPARAPNIIAGDLANSATAGAYGATIAGGGEGDAPNQVSVAYGAVGGGSGNRADGYGGTVAGGFNNVASGTSAMVPGGLDNVAAGLDSFAAGQHSRANHDGTFVWNNDPLSDFSSTSNGQFLIRATGGVGITQKPSTTSYTPSEALDVDGNVKADGLCIGTDCRTAWPTGGGSTLTGVTAGAGLTGGGTAGNVTLGIAAAGVTNAMLQNSAVTFNAGLGLSGGGTVSLGGNRALAVDFTTAQMRVNGACAIGTAIQTVNGDGTVACVPIVSGFGGTGTQNALARFVDGGTLGPSQIADDGTNVTVGSTGGLRILAHTMSPNLVGGSTANSVGASALGATIAGGGDDAEFNRITAPFGSIGGGAANQAGDDPVVSGSYATVGGGLHNTASGFASTIAGGQSNTASGYASFAGGLEASAVTDGTFVWADTAGVEFKSTAPHQFLIRASGGVGIGVNNPGQALDVAGNVKADGLCIGTDCRTAWPTGGTGTGSIVGVTAGAGLTGGGTTGDVTLSVATGGITNTMLQNSSLTLNPGSGLTGSGTIALGGTGAPLSVDFTTTQKRVSGNCTGNTAVQTVNGDGTVGCVAFGSGAIAGGGTPNKVSKFSTATTVGDSQIADDGTNVTIAVASGGLSVLANGTSPNIVMGFSGNNAATGFVGAAIGGGGETGFPNQVTSDFATVGGGLGNTAVGASSTVSGGAQNIAGFAEATVGGGSQNQAQAVAATVGGGEFNIASGTRSTVPGGGSNTAAGGFSFAAGTFAKALHDGAFVWGDNTFTNFSSTAANQFSVRASGGVRIFSNSTLNAGVTLAPNASAWSTLSDRNAKENFSSVDGRVLLEKINAIPVETWSYKAQGAAVRHIGPMAQDFYAAFRVGEDDKHISTVDADGVALAGVQTLYRLLLQKDEEIAQQRKELQNLAAQIEALKVALNLTTERDKKH